MTITRLLCKSCGAGLEVLGGVERVVCDYCGVGWVVERVGSEVVLKAVGESLKRIEVSADIARENTQVIADQIRLPKIYNRIAQLEEAKSQINLKPMMVNPDYPRVLRERDEIRQEGEKYTKIVFTAAIILPCVVSPIGSWCEPYAFLRTICNILTVPIILLVTAGLLSPFWLMGIFVGKYPGLPAQHIINKELQAENIKAVEDLETEIADLEKRAYEIENSI